MSSSLTVFLIWDACTLWLKWLKFESPFIPWSSAWFMRALSIASNLFATSILFLPFLIFSQITLLSLLPDTFNFHDVVDKYPAYFRWGPWHPGRERASHSFVSRNSGLLRCRRTRQISQKNSCIDRSQDVAHKRYPVFSVESLTQTAISQKLRRSLTSPSQSVFLPHEMILSYCIFGSSTCMCTLFHRQWHHDDLKQANLDFSLNLSFHRVYPATKQSMWKPLFLSSSVQEHIRQISRFVRQEWFVQNTHSVQRDSLNWVWSNPWSVQNQRLLRYLHHRVMSRSTIVPCSLFKLMEIHWIFRHSLSSCVIMSRICSCGRWWTINMRAWACPSNHQHDGEERQRRGHGTMRCALLWPEGCIAKPRPTRGDVRVTGPDTDTADQKTHARTHLSDYESHPVAELRQGRVTGKRIFQIALWLKPQPHRHTTRKAAGRASLRLLFPLNLNRLLHKVNGKSGHLPDCPCDLVYHFITSQGGWAEKSKRSNAQHSAPNRHGHRCQRAVRGVRGTNAPRASCQNARTFVDTSYKPRASACTVRNPTRLYADYRSIDWKCCSFLWSAHVPQWESGHVLLAHQRAPLTTTVSHPSSRWPWTRCAY